MLHSNVIQPKTNVHSLMWSPPILGAPPMLSGRMMDEPPELDPNVQTKPLLRFTTCLIFKWYGKLKIQCTKWHENVGTWNLDLVCRSLSLLCGSDEILLVLMLVMVCHFYVIFWTWSYMLKYDRDRFPFLKPEHVMCVPFMNIHEYHINHGQWFDQFLWFFISLSKM